jgi:hypothetical protein
MRLLKKQWVSFKKFSISMFPPLFWHTWPFFSIRLWRTIHPVVITSKGLNMSGPMKFALIITFIAFCFLFFSMLISRIRLERLRRRIDEINEIMDDINFKRISEGM